MFKVQIRFYFTFEAYSIAVVMLVTVDLQTNLFTHYVVPNGLDGQGVGVQVPVGGGIFFFTSSREFLRPQKSHILYILRSLSFRNKATQE
jgi:hypothetical protein